MIQYDPTKWPADGFIPPSPVKYHSDTFKYFIADFKVSVSTEHKYHSKGNAVTKGNYKKVMDAMINHAAVNGLRMPMIPLHEKTAEYPDLEVMKNVYEYAQMKNMVIFASPMPDTAFGWVQTNEWSDDRFVEWIMDYVKQFKYIHFLGPWNEQYLYSKKNQGIIQRLGYRIRKALQEAGSPFDQIQLVGPDEVTIQKSIKSLDNEKNKGEFTFDVVGAHTQIEDVYGTIAGWQDLGKRANGKPVWNTEGMTQSYSLGDACTGTTKDNGSLTYSWCLAGCTSTFENGQVGCNSKCTNSDGKTQCRKPIKAAVDAGVQGWVHWGTTGKSGLIHAKNVGKSHHGLTKEGCLIAAGLRTGSDQSATDCEKLS